MAEERKPPLGTGERFRALVRKLRRRGNVRDPEALAAHIGRQEHGASRMAELAARGRRRRMRQEGAS
ncbi:MAG TPA: hypothetical protein VF226_04870 [Hyphomicrobiaceae bacterium]